MHLQVLFRTCAFLHPVESCSLTTPLNPLTATFYYPLIPYLYLSYLPPTTCLTTASSPSPVISILLILFFVRLFVSFIYSHQLCLTFKKSNFLVRGPLPPNIIHLALTGVGIALWKASSRSSNLSKENCKVTMNGN